MKKFKSLAHEKLHSMKERARKMMVKSRTIPCAEFFGFDVAGMKSIRLLVGQCYREHLMLSLPERLASSRHSNLVRVVHGARNTRPPAREQLECLRLSARCYRRARSGPSGTLFLRELLTNVDVEKY